MSRPEPTPEQLYKQAQMHYKPNPYAQRQEQDSAMKERLATLDNKDVIPRMDFGTYTKTIKPTKENNMLEKLLTTHRDSKQQEKFFDQTIAKNPEIYRRPFGEFSYEVERNINAGYLKRK